MDSEKGVSVVNRNRLGGGCQWQRVKLEDDETSHTLGGTGKGGT